MRRTTIFLDPELLRRVRRLAERDGKSLAAVVREALAAYLAVSTGAAGRLPSVAGRFASGTTDTAERTDELLWTEPHD